MKKNIIVRSLVNGILTFVLVTLVLHLVKGVAFAEAILAPYNIFLTISAIVGSYIGFSFKRIKE